MGTWRHEKVGPFGDLRGALYCLSKTVNEQKKDALKRHRDLMPPEGGVVMGARGASAGGVTHPESEAQPR